MRAVLAWTITGAIIILLLVAVARLVGGAGGDYDGTTPRHYDFGR